MIITDFIEVRVIIYDSEESNKKSKKAIINQFNIDFRKLVPLGDLTFTCPEVVSLPINTIIFATDTILFTTDILFQKIKSSGLISSNKLISTQSNYDDFEYDNTEKKLVSIRDRIKKSNELLASKRNNVIQVYEEAEKSRKAVDTYAKTLELKKVIVHTIKFLSFLIYSCLW
jgi:hypothetical protein